MTRSLSVIDTSLNQWIDKKMEEENRSFSNFVCLVLKEKKAQEEKEKKDAE